MIIQFMLLLLAVVSLPLFAQTNSQVERINFFPATPYYADASYQYQVLTIDTPSYVADDNELVNLAHSLNLVGAFKFKEKFFLGMRLQYEEASENAVVYGMEAPERFSSHGFREPELFMTWRIRDQHDDKGLIDFFLTFSDSLGAREVGSDTANRLNGRNTIRSGVSHGLLEDRWEFKTALELQYFGEGEEVNHISESTYTLSDYKNFLFKFSAQHEFRDICFINAGIGAIYRGSQDLKSGNDSREIQSGSGSLFELGAKRPISKTAVVYANYQLTRHEYFVKGTSSNLDGDMTFQTFVLGYVVGF